VDGELEVIRDEMEHTRASLADKLQALEGQVSKTVSGASETVGSAVEGVKDVVEGVSETVESVTNTLNIPKHIENHPWAAIGIAVGVGFMAAQLFSRSGNGNGHTHAEPRPDADHPRREEAGRELAGKEQHEQEPAKQEGFLESLLPDMQGVLGTATTGVSSLAVGSVMAIVREMVVHGLPDHWKNEMTELVDDITKQLGGKPAPADDAGDKGGQPTPTGSANGPSQPHAAI